MVFQRNPVRLRCVDVNPRHLTLVELERGDCRYPYGAEIEGDAVTFCGHRRRKGSSYCTPHFHLTRKAPKSRPSGLCASRRFGWSPRPEITEWRSLALARRKRRKPFDPSTAYDRRALDLPLNAEVAAVEVDDPFGTEPGDKIVALRVEDGTVIALYTNRIGDRLSRQALEVAAREKRDP